MLLYLAKPAYGGWVTFTAHLARCLGIPLVFKASDGTRMNVGDFGYGVRYQNIPMEATRDVLITAIDKNHYQYAERLKAQSYSIVVHDPTEINDRSIAIIRKAKAVFVIRRTMHDYLAQKHNIQSTFIPHPFFEYPTVESSIQRRGAVSVSRVDYDKHTEIILEANTFLEEPVRVYGSVNRMYVHFKLDAKAFSKCYHGTFPKSFASVHNILSGSKFCVDMSAIKNDGGGTQYSFLEAIYAGAALVLNKKWVDGKSTLFQDGKNCFLVGSASELVHVLRNKDPQTVALEATKLLVPHLVTKEHLLKTLNIS